MRYLSHCKQCVVSTKKILIMRNEFLDIVGEFKAGKKKMDCFDPYYFHFEDAQSDVYRNICILGGGLAGYLTAIAFRKFFDLPVTVIESSKIPVIGVGEATTPLMEDYLFGVLELDKKEFYQKVEANLETWN
jgi:hypothetical protein